MADQERALRLAALIQSRYGNDINDAAAAELRRLHAENERLHQINHAHEMKLSVRGYEIQIEDLRLAHAELRKVNAELLEALKLVVHLNERDVPMTDEELRVCRAAIAKATGEKT
jgi:hypothetical protein